MKKRSISVWYIVSFAFFITMLSGCSSWISPKHAAPSLKSQCADLKRRPYFTNRANSDQEEWQMAEQRMELDKAYKELGCGEVSPKKEHAAASDEQGTPVEQNKAAEKDKASVNEMKQTIHESWVTNS